jgi:hypothetical protein
MAHILQKIDCLFVVLSNAAMLKEALFQRLTERRMWHRTFLEPLSQQPSTNPLFTIIMERLQMPSVFPMRYGEPRFSPRIRYMKVRVGMWIWIAGCLSLLSATCSAQSICPWLNVATASGVLGGAATVEVNATDISHGSCVFQLQDVAKKGTLRISVVEANDPESAGNATKPAKISCASSGMPLKGVGNEAVLCPIDRGESRGEQVVGRVRDRMFTVVISDGSGKGLEAKSDPLAEKAESVAKAVAGALF